MTDLRVSTYMNTRLLKTTEASTITESLRRIYVPPDQMEDANFAIVNAKVSSVELASLRQKLMCLKRKHTVEKALKVKARKMAIRMNFLYVTDAAG